MGIANECLVGDRRAASCMDRSASSDGGVGLGDNKWIVETLAYRCIDQRCDRIWHRAQHSHRALLLVVAGAVAVSELRREREKSQSPLAREA